MLEKIRISYLDSEWYYYLENDVQISSAWTPKKNTATADYNLNLHICFNGHRITMKDGTSSATRMVLSYQSGGTTNLSFCDCKANDPATLNRGGIFGSKGAKKPGRIKSPRERTMNLGGKDTSVILFSPKNFDEAGELVGYLNQDLTVVMTLEGVPGETARRLLDFLSGIAFALQGKITPVSAKTYFITSQNVDILGAQGQAEQPESAGHYF